MMHGFMNIIVFLILILHWTYFSSKAVCWQWCVGCVVAKWFYTHKRITVCISKILCTTTNYVGFMVTWCPEFVEPWSPM